MPAIAFQVKSAEPHPNADSLRLYKMECPSRPDVQIVANLENVYEVGDKVIVALVDSILNDTESTVIKLARIRGLHSHGMALGKTDQPVGTDLSADHCSGFVKRGSMIKWPDIEGFHNVVRNLKAMRDLGEGFTLPKVTYRAKIKLHGTNAAVQVSPEGDVFAQSRTSVITKENDNAGFARWVDENVEFFKELSDGERTLTFFGEWCGKDIQKNTAINQIDKRIFAIFALQIGEVTGEQMIQAEPVVITDWLWPRFSGSSTKQDDIFVLPWYNSRQEFVLDYGDKDGIAKVVEEINGIIAEVEAVDPWVKETFNVEGLGEGLVFYPNERDGKFVDMRDDYSDLFFKAKGEKHKVVKQKEAVQINPEVAKSIDEFVELFVTPARLDQAVTAACDGKYDMKLSGSFLKWINTDIKKESVAELEASKMDWKQVAKAVSSAAITWYKGKVEEL